MRAALLSLALFTACYSPGYRNCEVTCATSQACPNGFQCSASGFCVTNLSMTCMGSDGGMDDGGGGDAGDANPNTPFGTPMPVPFVTGTPMNIDDKPTLTDNMLLLYVRRRVGTPPLFDIYGSTRSSVSAVWPSPGQIDLSIAATNEMAPELQPTGLEIYFSSDRTGGAGALDVFYSNRPSLTATWGAPGNLNNINSAAVEDSPAVSRDGLTMVFASTRSGIIDLYIANRMMVTQAFGMPMEMTALNDAAYREESPFLSADKLTIYFSSNRGGSFDLYTATRSSVTASFGTVKPIMELNTPNAAELDPWVSMDGKTIYFTREVNGLPTIMYATR